MPRRPFIVLIDDPEMTQAYEFRVEALDEEFAKTSAAVLALACEIAKQHPNGISSGIAEGFVANEELIQATKVWATVR